MSWFAPAASSTNPLPLADHPRPGRLNHGPYMSVASALEWPLRAAKQSFWAVADQGLFAASNLLVNVLLARWLPPSEYGAFATAYAILLLVSVAHVALLIEPMLVFGSGKYATRSASYFRILLRYHWYLSGLGSVVIGGVAYVLWLSDAATLAAAVASLAVAAPFIFLSWLARRACYLHSRPAWAAAGGVLNLVLVSGGALVLYAVGLLSVMSASILIASAGVVVGAWLLRRLDAIADDQLEEPPRSAVYADHWHYGRWAAGTGVLAWVPIYAYYLVLPTWSGLEASAALKALFNLILPILHSDSALTTLLVPVLVRARASAGRFRHLLRLAALMLAIEGVVYWLMLGIFREELIVTIYGGSYRGYANLLWLLGLLPLAAGLLNVLGSALRALEQADDVFWSTVAAVVVTLGVGIGAVRLWGITGSIVGMLLSWLVQIAAMSWFLSKRQKALA